MQPEEAKAKSTITRFHSLRATKDHSIQNVSWSPNGQLLAIASSNTIWLWNLQTKEFIPNFKWKSNSSIYSIAWSPSGNKLAFSSANGVAWISSETGKSNQMKGDDPFFSVAWSPDETVLAAGSIHNSVLLWDPQNGESLFNFTGHTYTVRSLAWSPNGKFLASGSFDSTIRIWDTEKGELLHTLKGHTHRIYCVVWSPDGQTLASGSDDRTIYIWSPFLGTARNNLEGHTDLVTCVVFSNDGHLLISKSRDNTVRIWNADTWDTIEVLNDDTSTYYTNLAYHPKNPILVTTNDKSIHFFDLNITSLLNVTPAITNVHYTNAKVVLVGDSGVGKSGLGLVLNGQQFQPTESTHGRHVWTFESEEVVTKNGLRETRETLLWDLAGQPGYRLIHQLHLNEVAVALVVFDSRSETDPFAGVQHWNRALLQAQRIQGSSALPMKKFLVASRIDRGGIGVSRERIQSIMEKQGFDGYFETSAKEGWHIEELKETIRSAIDWDTLPKVSSTTLFQHIKSFIVSEKEAGRILSTIEDLYRMFQGSESYPDEIGDLRAQFETCIGRVESRGLIKRLSFGNLILLQPEILDAYATALVNAVKDEPDGLGSIDEKRVRMGDFPIPSDERIKEEEQEKLLLIAMVEDLLRHELVLREEPFLVFPSQSTRENPNLPDPEGKFVSFEFEGPVLNIYVTLAVRLSNCGFFLKKEMWKDAITYMTSTGGVCGMYLHNLGEGGGKLTLFFDKVDPPSEEMRYHFEEYVQIHLSRRALEGSVKRLRIFICNKCSWIVTDQTIQLTTARGLNSIQCPICSSTLSLLEQEQRALTIPTPPIVEMDHNADQQRNQEVNKSTLQGRKEIGDFDVFLCHNNSDKATVKKIGEQLKKRGILPWLDEWELRPGLPWQRLLEKQIEQIKSAAVFVGPNGIGPWQHLEMEAFLREFVNQGKPIIPVLLPNTELKSNEIQLPIFLKGMTWVDFRKKRPDPMMNLIWGITGNH